MLFVDPTDDGVTRDSALWVEPTLVFKDGRRQPLSGMKWTHADVLWDSASIRRSTEKRPLTFRGQSIGAVISTLAASRIEYALPPEVVRFTATGAVDERVKAPAEGRTVRFVAATGPQATGAATGVPIRVALRELGLSGSVRTRDLWTRREVGVSATGSSWMCRSTAPCCTGSRQPRAAKGIRTHLDPPLTPVRVQFRNREREFDRIEIGGL